MTMHRITLLAILFASSLVAGCNAKHSAETTNADQLPNQNEYEHFIVVASIGRDSSKVADEIIKLVQRAAPGDVIHFFTDGGQQHRVSRMVVPDIENRTRDQELSQQVSKTIDIVESLKTTVGTPVDTATLLSTIWGHRETNRTPRIVLIGSPLYHEGGSPWDFRVGAPSNSALYDDDSTLPHRPISGTLRLPSGSQCRWLLFGENFGNSPEHEDSIILFYRRMFRYYGAELYAMTTSPELAFDEESPPQFTPLTASEPDPLPPRIIRYTPASVPVIKPISQKSETATSQGLSAFVEQARRDSRTIIAISWQHRYVDTDVDIYLRSTTSAAEMMFRRMNVPGVGTLHRDITNSQGTAQSQFVSTDDIVASWEAVTVEDGASIEELELYLNAYEARPGPIPVTVLVVSKGRLTEQSVTIPCVDGGDKAGHSARRDSSPAWLRVDLRKVTGR